MPQKINMFISNGNHSVNVQQQQQVNIATLGSNPSMAAPKAPSALNAPFISRVHNVRPGCGSCGRH
jgi:hypothetical protein